MNCKHCEKKLKESIRADNNNLKSCPKCSQDHVSGEHVFYSFPKRFGVTPLRASPKHPDGAQSYCIDCRQKNSPTYRDAILCSAVVT